MHAGLHLEGLAAGVPGLATPVCGQEAGSGEECPAHCGLCSGAQPTGGAAYTQGESFFFR